MSSDVKIPVTAAQIDARMLVKHMRQAPDDWQRHEALAERALLAAEQRGRKAGLEEAAEVAANAEMRTLNDKGGTKPIWGRGLIAAAIRLLGEKI